MERASSIQIINTAYALARSGAEVHLLVRKMDRSSLKECLAFYGLNPHPSLKVHQLPVLNIHGSPLWNKSFYFSAMAAMFCLILFKGARTIYLRDIGLACFVVKLRRLFPLKVYFEAHQISFLEEREKPALFTGARTLSEAELEKLRLKEEFVCKYANGVVTTNSQIKNLISRLFGRSQKVEVIANGTAPGKFASEKEKSPGKIIYMGQLYPWKGVDTLVRAMRFVNEKGTLHIVGGFSFEKDIERVRMLAGEIGVGSKIVFHEFVPPARVPQFLADAEVGVIPLPDNITTRSFTCPLKLFEYMAASVPVVAARLPTIEEVVSDGKDALLYAPGDEKDLADKINRLLRDVELAGRLSLNAREAAGKYSWAARAEKIRALIETESE